MADPAFQELGTLEYKGANSANSLASTISNVTDGDIVFAFVQRDGGANITGVSATGFGTFQLIATNTQASGFQCRVYVGVANASAGSRVVTASFSNSAAWGAMYTSRYSPGSGLASLTPLDVGYNVAAANDVAATSTSRGCANNDVVVASGKRALIIAAGTDWDYYNTHTGVNSYSMRVHADTFGNDTTTQWYYDRVVTEGTYGGTGTTDRFGTIGTSDQYMCALVALEINAGTNTYTHSGSGGITMGGAATTQYISAVSPGTIALRDNGSGTGDISLSGSSTNTYTHSAAGGVSTGGAAEHSRTFSHSTAGGAQSGGAASKNITKVYTGSGGAQTGGEAEKAFCHVFEQSMSGGAVSGGAATKLVTKVYTGSGGAQTGGAAAKVRTFAHATSGGVTAAGAATKTRVWTHATDGGVVTSGAATKVRTFTHSATGGAQSGGAATTSYVPAGLNIYTHSMTGGAQTGGAASKCRTFIQATAGGAVTGGAATKTRTFTHATAGGAQAGGAATKVRTFTHATAGGAVTGGAATTQYIANIVEYVHSTSGGVTTGGSAIKSVTFSHETSGGVATGGEATTVYTQPVTLPTETKLQSLAVLPPMLPALPALPAGLEPDLRRLLLSMKERMEIAGGDIASYGRAITYYDVATAPPGAFVNVPADVYPTPPAPTGLSAAGAFTSVTFSWDMATYYGHSHTEVWRYPTDNIGSATMNSIWYGAVGSDLTATGTGYYYWIRHVNKGGVPGPFNAVHGVFAATAPDVDFLLNSLEDKITELQLEGEVVEGQEAFIFNTKLFAIYDPSAETNKLPFAVVSQSFTNNGVNVPAGVYMRDAFIQNGAIVNAKIGNLAVDDAKIFNLSATKITAGDIHADRMRANFLSAARAEIASLSSITANIGDIRAGILSNNGYLPSFYRYVNLNATADANAWFIVSHNAGGVMNFGVRGDGYVYVGGPQATLVGGAITGYAWPAAGAGHGFYLGPSGFLVGNANAGNYFQWDYSTNAAYCNGLFIYGNSHFYGVLEGASGTFAGALSAATGTFAGSLSAATGTFAGSLSAATGTFSGSLTANAVNAVSTINIAGNAVTIPLYTEVGDGGSQTTYLVSPATLVDLGAQTYYGGTVVVMIMLDVEADATFVFIQRNGANIKSMIMRTGTSQGRGTVNITFADAPGAGVHNYRALVVPNASSAYYRRYYANLLTLEARR